MSCAATVDVTRFVVLLRAVNVGGRTLSMAALRDACETSGCTDVQTYIQSGNAVLTASTRSASTVERDVHDAIAAETGMDVTVLVRTTGEMQKIVASNPFVGPGVEARRLHVIFLARQPKASAESAVDAAKHAPERFRIAGREVYLDLPSGHGTSKLVPAVVRAVGVPATTRNWNTVTKLADLVSR
jgi:uncharacterized protein (DUF1697 family)